ncbi:hypothetical protein D3C86_1358510 [compost metagenome]
MASTPSPFSAHLVAVEPSTLMPRWSTVASVSPSSLRSNTKGSQSSLPFALASPTTMSQASRRAALLTVWSPLAYSLLWMAAAWRPQPRLASLLAKFMKALWSPRLMVGPSYLPVAISSLASSMAFAPAWLQVLMGCPSTPVLSWALALGPLAVIGEVSISPLRAASRLR